MALLVGGIARASSTESDEVIVTAQRRPEPLQRSSLVVSVYDEDDVARARISQVTDLNALVPGIQVATGGAPAQVYIRGVGDYSATAFAESAVTFTTDGVVLGRPTAINGQFFDLQRIEVLKGPQGTLYGRNASGGAINLITRKPGRHFGGYVGADVGNYGLKRFNGAVDLPVNDALAFRAAFQTVDRDGYLKGGYDDEKSRAGRLHAVWQPHERLSLRVTGDFVHLGGKGAGSSILPNVGDPRLGPNTAPVRAFLAAHPSVGRFPLTLPRDDGFLDNDMWSVGAELNWDMGFATLTLLPAYRDLDLAYRTYVPSFQFDEREFAHQTSLESRLSRKGERITWVAGLYYFDEGQGASSFGSLGQTPGASLYYNFVDLPRIKTESFALFGEADVSVSKRLRVIAGLRYTRDDKSVRGHPQFFSNAFLPSPPFPICNSPLNQGAIPCYSYQFEQKLSTTRLNWKAGLEYDLTAKSLLFVTASTGYKAGGIFLSPNPNNVFRPEYLLAYELGSRNRFLHDTLQVNLEAFYWIYKDHQESHFGVDSNGALSFQTINAGRSTIYGVELDVQWRPVRTDNIRFTLEYVHSRYDDFSYQQPAFAVTANVTTGCRVGRPMGGPPFFGTPIDCSGFQLVRTPLWSGTARYEHIFPLENGASLVAGLDTQFATERWLAVDFIQNERTKPYATGNFDLTYNAPDARWSLSAYVRNFTNAAVYTGGFESLVPRTVFATINPPRTFGLRLRANF